MRLGEVARIDRRSVQPEDIADGQVYLGLEHIETGGYIAKANAVNAGDLKSSKFAFDTRHVLFGKLRPNLAKVARPSFEGVCSTDIVPILPGPNLDRDYLANFLLTPQIVDWASSRTSGVNLPRLSPSVLEGLEIPLPPLPEQRRIASTLDDLDQLRRQRRAAIAATTELLTSAFIEDFGDPLRTASHPS
ncbi:MAG TPA: restriction endonuclease subunit S, partial [Rhodoglobus sp.]|nr:restriction endonuclease subunit S [Rhodoglobus sp.]